MIMLHVCIAILVVFVAGAFSWPIDHDKDFPLSNADLLKSAIKIHPELRLALVDTSKYWPDATMYYTIDPIFTEYERGVIQSAIDDIEKYTCVKIKPRTDEYNYVKIVSVPGRGCRSTIGMMNRPQSLNLEQTACFHPEKGKGTAIHELLHALGFFHQHSAHNRDDYIVVLESNIAKADMINFQKEPESVASDFGFGYDLNSVMHYDMWSFAVDKNLPTIVGKDDPNTPIGQRYGLSIGDIDKLNYMYNCPT